MHHKKLRLEKHRQEGSLFTQVSSLALQTSFTSVIMTVSN